MLVYVQNKDGKPLMPTSRCGKVRRLLKTGKAIVVEQIPFTIRICYDTTNYVQPVTLGVDSGTKHIGLSATSNSRELYASTGVKCRYEVRNEGKVEPVVRYEQEDCK